MPLGDILRVLVINLDKRKNHSTATEEVIARKILPKPFPALGNECQVDQDFYSDLGFLTKPICIISIGRFLTIR